MHTRQFYHVANFQIKTQTIAPYFPCASDDEHMVVSTEPDLFIERLHLVPKLAVETSYNRTGSTKNMLR